jgi:hypothetical protein
MDDFMEEFMKAMKEVFPHLLVQFEDFSTDNAFKYLEVFRNRYRCFNDDVCVSSSLRLPDFILSVILDSGHWSGRFEWLANGVAFPIVIGTSLFSRFSERGPSCCFCIRPPFNRSQNLILRRRFSGHWCCQTTHVVLHTFGSERR